MKWPQIELWRLFAAMGLLGAAFACVRATLTASEVEWPIPPPLIAIYLLGAAVGTPFKKGIIGAICALPVFVFLLVLIAGIWELF